MSSPDTIDGVADLVAQCKASISNQNSKRSTVFRNSLDGQHHLSNLVLQGGGMLGAAHVGFVHGLEAAGIRIAGIAGASAGSIVGMAIACARKGSLTAPTSPLLWSLISEVRPDSFIDGPRRIRSLIKNLLRGGPAFTIGNAIAAHGAYRRLLRTRGLNRGDVFEQWLGSRLDRELGVGSIDELERHLASIESQLAPFHHTSCSIGSAKVLKLMAAELDHGIKFEFPRDLRLVYLDRALTSPAKLVRASMAIPIFFEPVRFRIIQQVWAQEVKRRLKDLLAPDEIDRIGHEQAWVTLVDGGAYSNLPVDAFDAENTLPTIAVTLVQAAPPSGDVRAAGFSALLADAQALLNGIKAQRDRDAAISMRSRGVEFISIDTTGFDWLNFMASKSDVEALFLRGVKAAARFLT